MFRTKYCGPTDSHCARVRVEDCWTNQRVYVIWDAALGVEENHTAAFKAIVEKDQHLSSLQWVRMPTVDGYYYVSKGALRDVE